MVTTKYLSNRLDENTWLNIQICAFEKQKDLKIYSRS